MKIFTLILAGALCTSMWAGPVEDAKRDYERDLEAAIKPITNAYIKKLKTMEDSALKSKNLTLALALADERLRLTVVGSYHAKSLKSRRVTLNADGSCTGGSWKIHNGVLKISTSGEIAFELDPNTLKGHIFWRGSKRHGDELIRE